MVGIECDNRSVVTSRRCPTRPEGIELGSFAIAVVRAGRCRVGSLWPTLVAVTLLIAGCGASVPIPSATSPSPTVSTSQCALEAGDTVDRTEIIVTGPSGSCERLSAALATLAMWDRAPVSEPNLPLVCAGEWGGARVDVDGTSDVGMSDAELTASRVCVLLQLPSRSHLIAPPS